MDNSFDQELKSYAEKSSQENRDKIHTFIETNKLEIQEYDIQNTRLLLITDNLDAIDEHTIAKYINAQKAAEKRGILNNCFSIAARAVQNKSATGCLYTNEGAQDFVGWGNHCINYDYLDDGSIVAVDLTSRHNIDRQQGQFDILALKAPNMKLLVERVNNLFGGSWTPQTKEQVQETLRTSYY